MAVRPAPPEELGARWGTEAREREYWRRVTLPVPAHLTLEAGALAALPGGGLAVGTRHGEVVLVEGVDAPAPEPSYRIFASGLDEVLGLHPLEDGLLVTQSCELTRVRDTRGDGRADRFDALSNLWGYRNYHEYAFSTPPDAQGSVFVALGLSYSYRSEALFRGWVLEVTADGETRPHASGLRSPGGIGFDASGQLFYIERQGPWNSSCSLKAVTRDSFRCAEPRHRTMDTLTPSSGEADGTNARCTPPFSPVVSSALPDPCISQPSSPCADASCAFRLLRAADAAEDFSHVAHATDVGTVSFNGVNSTGIGTATTCITCIDGSNRLGFRFGFLVLFVACQACIILVTKGRTLIGHDDVFIAVTRKIVTVTIHTF